MRTRINLAGQTLGRLTVIRESRPGRWECKCSCGNIAHVAHGELTRTTKTPTRSCGCLRRENLHTYHRKHGQCGTRTYTKWKSMLIRTRDSHLKKNSCYRGISVCKRWKKFENFLADMGEAPPDLTLERINNSRGYSPSNCRWASWKEQMNNHSGVHLITFRGKTQSMKAWADELGIGYTTLANRINKSKWPIEKALSAPVA